MHRSSSRHQIERIGLSIGILLAVIIIVAVINSVLQSDQGPMEPTPAPTLEPTIGPTAPATPATPAIVFDSEPKPEQGSLLHMLGYAPDRLQDDSLPLSDIARYANIKTWMNARGVTIPADANDPAWVEWENQLSILALPEIIANRGTDDAWISTYGFGLHQVNQVLAVGSAPDYVMVIRGDFNEDKLLATWAESGYQAVRVDGFTYWSLNPGGSVDLSAPASRPALGNMNNLVLLEDGTLIATSRSDRLEQTLAVIDGANDSLADNESVRSILRPGIEPDRLATAVLLKGTVLEEHTSAPSAISIATPVPELPRATLLLTGLHVPIEGESRATLVIVVVYDSAPDAIAAESRARRILAGETSNVTGQPYSERLHSIAMRVVSSSDSQQLLLIHLVLQHDTADWLNIIEERDLGFLMWPRVP